MEEKEKITEMAVSDAVTEKPIFFNIGRRKFSIHPPNLGKMQILSKYYLALDIDEDKLNKEPHLEAMRICADRTDVVCSLMSVATYKSKDDLLNDEKIKQRAEFFKWNSNPEHFSSVILALLTQVNYANFMLSIRLTRILRQNASKV